MQIFRQITVVLLTAASIGTTVMAQRKSRPVKQPLEVVQAYRVCAQFQRILSENLDFNAAFESTFTTSRARQRAIAMKEGEFDGVDFTGVDDQTLINAYKSRMQLLYLMLPLISPIDEEEEKTFFPPDIEEMFKRKAPATATEFASFASQLERDATDFRAHLMKLESQHPEVAERVRKFKRDLVRGDFQPPKSTVVKPLKYYGGGEVLRSGELYYQVEGYTVVREGTQMKIAGIRFFTRLF